MINKPASARANEVDRRIASWLLEQAEQAASAMKRTGRKDLLDKLEEVRRFLRDAMEQSLLRGEVEFLFRLSSALEQFWLIHGLRSNEPELLERALKASSAVALPFRARALRTMGIMKHLQYTYSEARDYLKRCFDLIKDSDQQEEVAWTLFNLGLTEIEQDSRREALEYHRACLDLFTKLRHERGIALALNELGYSKVKQGDLNAGLRDLKKSVEIFSRLGDQISQAWASYNLGQALSDRGDTRQSLYYIANARELFRNSEYKLGIPWTDYSEGIVVLNAGDPGKAQDYVEQALEEFYELGNEGGISWSRHILGRITFEKYDYKSSAEHYKAFIDTCNKFKMRSSLAFGLEGFARLATAKRNPEIAARLFGAAESLRSETISPLPIADYRYYTRDLDAVCNWLNEAAFSRQLAKGRELPLELILLELEEFS